MYKKDNFLHLGEYQVSPLVYRADADAEVTVKPLSPHIAFSGREYLVRVLGANSEFVQDQDGARTYRVRPSNGGALRFTHHFPGEQEHLVYVYHPSETDMRKFIVALPVYSLEADLYGRKPWMGNFHAHSTASDGAEDGRYVAAGFAEHGFDFLAITDH